MHSILWTWRVEMPDRHSEMMCNVLHRNSEFKISFTNLNIHWNLGLNSGLHRNVPLTDFASKNRFEININLINGNCLSRKGRWNLMENWTLINYHIISTVMHTLDLVIGLRQKKQTLYRFLGAITCRTQLDFRNVKMWKSAS